jgi:hypothetical protein
MVVVWQDRSLEAETAIESHACTYVQQLQDNVYL